MKIGGIDVGTTGAKLTVYNEYGELLNKAYITYEVSRNTGEHEIDVNSLVSMNMWALKAPFVDLLKEGFAAFLQNLANPLKDEFLLPIFIDQLLQQHRVSVRGLETPDQWFGVTYKEDREAVMQSLRALAEGGAYKKDLYGDL